MIKEIGALLEWVILAFPILSIYVTTVHYGWWKFYQPSPLIKHLLISSIAVDVASVMVSIVALTILFDIDLPDGLITIMIGGSLVLSMGVKVWRRIDLRALDHPGEDIIQRVETQNQREDRNFGDKRRSLEETHKSADQK